jgi:hypothetical protein
VYYSQLADLLFASFQGGITIGGQVEPSTGFFSGFKICPSEDEHNKGPGLYSTYNKFGENIVSFKDLGKVTSNDKNDSGTVYI